MADKKVYQHWRNCAEEVEAVTGDPSLALWQKVRQVGDAYAGLALEGLKSKHRHKILNGFGKVNAVFSRYEIDRFEDYEKIEEEDLKAILTIVRSLAPPK